VSLFAKSISVMVKPLRSSLVVESDSVARGALSRLLSSLGHTLMIAANMKEARRELLNNPAIVILDPILPDGHGIEIFRQMRHDESKAVVAVVCGTEDEKLAELFKLKPDAVFGRPIDLADFRDWLTQLEDTCI
jgi:DNA-binding response OmpR family regulator